MKRGFTLIELVILMSILGIMVVLYTSSTGDLSDVSVDAASRKVQSDIRYAHQLATSTGVDHGAVFTQNGGYEVYSWAPGNPVIDPVTREDMVVALDDFEGVTISNNYQVKFNSRGEPVTGGDGRVTLTATSGAVRDVRVIDKTGAVVIDLIEYGAGCSCQLCEWHEDK